MTNLPPLPFKDWEETKITLHLFAQIVGKVRLGLSPRINHWWHVPFYVSARGLTTSSIPHGDHIFEMEFDLVEHQLVIRAADHATRRIPLQDMSVAAFYAAVLETLDHVGIRPRMIARPFDTEKTKSDIPFADDNTHKTYDPNAVSKFWTMLVEVERIFRTFRGRFVGKCSPVHFFWHSFDLAVTRFSGRAVDVPAGADPVTREAYSHEVISHGFWPGDDNTPAPAFYSYTAPEPSGIAKEILRPAEAWWQDMGTSSMALYKYDDFRAAPNPEAALLDFLQSSYEAGAKLGKWPRQELETT